MTKQERAHDVLDFLDSRRDDLIDFACELVATPSINPPGDERAVAKVILDKLSELGLEGAEVVAREPHRPNLVYRQRGRSGSPSLILNGHSDTKPVGNEDRKLWKTDPLEPTIIDGKLYGLGSTDMKGSVAAMIYTAAALGALDPPVRGDLLLIMTADEEAGQGAGARWLVQNLELTADFCLVAEPCGITEEFENIPLSARRSLRFLIKVFGTQMHSSVSDILPSVNASVKMAWVLWRMAQDLKLTYEPHPLYPQGPTVNLGDFISGGVYYGVYPGYAEFGSDIRMVPGMSADRARKDIEAFLDDLMRQDPELKVEYEFMDDGRGARWDGLKGDEPFVQTLAGAARRVLGKTLPLGGFPAFTDAYWFDVGAGIPSIPAFGPGLLPLGHGPNECVSVEGIVQASKIFALAALNYLDAGK